VKRRVAVIVLDGVGCGAAHDAAAYGDVGSNTLGHVLDQVSNLSLPAMERLGLGHVGSLRGVTAVASPAGTVTVLEPRSSGKDSTTGHWEIAGVVLETPFPTFPHGFPASVIDVFTQATGRGVIGNAVASGTAVLDALGGEHVATGKWIVYTSADSVFQIAAHESIVPLTELYRACEIARELLVEPNNVSRVIARPFIGADGVWQRTPNRRDYSIAPVGETLLDALQAAGVPRDGIGKVDDLFASRAITSTHTTDNADGIQRIERWLSDADSGLLFANLVDFDQQFGHRNDVVGFAGALAQFDRALPSMLTKLRDDDLLFITADHGNDPTTASTDHARERVPLLVTGPRVRSAVLPARETFADVGATVAHAFGLAWRGGGESFLPELSVA
jgi:phosphopentomutase